MDPSKPDKVGAFVSSAIDAATGGLADTAQGYINKYIRGAGPTTEELRRQTEQLRGDIGPVGSMLADVTGYALGPGEFKLGAKAAEWAAPKVAAAVGERAAPYLARIGGSAAESAGASAVGALGHGGDVNDAIQNAKAGALIGVLTGAIPGGRGAQAPKEGVTPTPGLQADVQPAYAPLKEVHLNPADVAPDFVGVTTSMSSGDRLGMGGDLKAKVKEISQELGDKIRGKQTVTADDITKYKGALQDSAGDATDRRIAGDYGRALDNSIATASPVAWGAVAPGTDVGKLVEQANLAAARAKSSEDIDAWLAAAQRGKTNVPDQIQAALDANTGFFRTEPGLRPLLQQAAASKLGRASDVGRTVGEHLASAALGSGAGYLFDRGDPTGAAVGGAVGAFSPVALRAALARGRQNSLIARLAQARALNATGDVGFRPDFNPGVPGFGPLVVYGRQGAPGLGASGMFVPPDQR